MPPLPSTVQGDVSDLIERLTRYQHDINEFQIPKLRSFKGSLAVQQQLAAELREDLNRFSRNVKLLQGLGEDQERERDRKEIANQVQLFVQSLEQMKKDMRMALLISKRAIDSSARGELLRSNKSHEKVSSEKSGNALMNTSNDVTEALHRTIGLMQGELERSVLSSQMLEQSSASLRSTTTVHDTLSTLLGTSKHLIKALEKSDWLDRLLILAAVAFFFLVVLFILKQRVLDRGIRIAFWWTRFLPHFYDGEPHIVRGETFTATSTTTTGLSTGLSAITSSGVITATDDPSVSSNSITVTETLSTLLQSDVATPDVHLDL